MQTKLERSILASVLMASLLITAAQAQTLSFMPEIEVQGAVQFVSGGIGSDESNAFKQAAQHYRLMLTFVQRGADGTGQYLADVPILITNAKHEIVLDTSAQGPYLLANLPAGRYTVQATANDVEKKQRINIGTHGTARIIFEWR